MKPYRRGFSLIECGAAGAMVVVLLSVSLQFFVAVGGHSRAARWRQIACQEAAGALERLAERPWDALDAEKTRDIALSQEAQSVLPGGTLSLHIQAEKAGTLESRRITAEVRWEPQPGHPESVQLVTWRYRRP